MSSKSNHDHEYHGASMPTLLFVFGALVVLMILTIVAARAPIFETLPVVANNIIAITIACAKATLVVAIFMGVKYSSHLVKLFAIGGFVWLILVFGIFIDYVSRPWEPVKGWEDVPATSMQRAPDTIVE